MGKANGRNLAGLIIILLGVIGLLNNFGITAVSFSYVLNLAWPLLLIAAGINLIMSRSPGNMATGAVMLGLGALFLGRNAGLYSLDTTNFWQIFWPVLIILIGLNILFKNDHNRGGNLAIMGAVDKSKEAWDLKSGDYTALLGGIDLDIRKARFIEKEVTLNLNAVMGGITLVVPDDIAVICKGTAILGGIDLLGRGTGGIVGSSVLEVGGSGTAANVLRLNCICIMGGIEIKH
ncbi:MAG: DUF5668 domain-containing protein [Syntrophomonadaceae bacterium]|nr:DUF5668 domain-containing protein [Syntrophomonadaceae bacterium]